ncbi:hypothetical protein CGZ80_02175 [Rhodopirellula sp. MGV]|nr:hypothetical protein CGZ80_02175 [Rhodopirellula sp. MGV]PNY34203.1 hypothetical protein C2E31_24655 [Rhodopirellula baltica]
MDQTVIIGHGRETAKGRTGHRPPPSWIAPQHQLTKHAEQGAALTVQVRKAYAFTRRETRFC